MVPRGGGHQRSFLLVSSDRSAVCGRRKCAYLQARKHSIFLLEHKHISQSRQPPLKKSSPFFGTDLQRGDEFVVELVVVEQVVVGAAVSYAPVFQHNDLVGIKDGGKPVRDGDHGAG